MRQLTVILVTAVVTATAFSMMAISSNPDDQARTWTRIPQLMS